MNHRHDEGYYRAAASWFLALDDGRKSNSYWAKVFDVTPEAIKDWREGGKVNRYRVSPELLARAEQMLKDGYSKRELEKVLGISRRTLGKRFPQKKKKRDGWAWAKELLEDGCSYAEVERSTGIPVRELRETYPGFSWTLNQVLEFQRAERNARKKMPLHVREIFFGP